MVFHRIRPYCQRRFTLGIERDKNINKSRCWHRRILPGYIHSLCVPREPGVNLVPIPIHNPVAGMRIFQITPAMILNNELYLDTTPWTIFSRGRTWQRRHCPPFKLRESMATSIFEQITESKLTVAGNKHWAFKNILWVVKLNSTFFVVCAA